MWLARDGRFQHPRLPGWALIGVVAALLALGGFAAREFSDNGLRLGSELVWRFNCLIYFAAITAGPLVRLIPLPALRRICEERRQVIWGFCAGFGVYLASILVPNTLPALDHPGVAAGATVFVLFGALLALVTAYAASDHAALFLGERSSKTIMGVGLSTFWLTYTAAGLARISAPHRPDMFYGFSLSLMAIALFLRFADRIVAKFRAFRETA